MRIAMTEHAGCGAFGAAVAVVVAISAMPLQSVSPENVPANPIDTGIAIQRAPANAARTNRVATNETLQDALRGARPGDCIVVAPGDYRGFAVKEVRGAADRPIVLRAEDPAKPPRFTAQVHFVDPSHLVLEDLLIEGSQGNGLNIDDGGSFESPTRDVTLRRLLVRDNGGHANHDGIKLSGVHDSLVDACVVERWGRQGSAIDMVGCRRVRIEDCTFRDRERDPPSNAVQAKGGSRDIRVRRCRFEHAGQRAVNIGGSTGLEYFRPLLDGGTTDRFEAKDVTVEGCTFIGSMAPIAFVGSDGATVRFNTFFRPQKWFLRILQETRGSNFVPCRNGVFSDNLIVYRAGEISTPVNVGPGTAPETFRFARNFWFAEDAPARSIPSLPAAETDAKGGVDPLLRDAASSDLRLRAGSPALAHGADALPPISSSARPMP